MNKIERLLKTHIEYIIEINESVSFCKSDFS